MESALSKFNEISVENLRKKVPPSLPQPVVGNMTHVFKKIIQKSALKKTPFVPKNYIVVILIIVYIPPHRDYA